MRPPWRWLATLLLTAGATVARGETLRVEVGGQGGRTCTAYFHTRGDALRWPVLLSLRGTGVYTTAATAQLDAAERALVDQDLVTLLTLDKPGISPDPENPDRVLINDALYNQYTQGDLVHCSREALAWAVRHADAAARDSDLLLSGHSEGAQVTLRLLANLESQGDALATRIKALYLSGLPMTDWHELLASQLSDADRRKFYEAFQRRDDAVLRSYGNLSYSYLHAVFAEEPLGRTLERLTELGSGVRFFLYQGLYDRQTAPGPLMDFVRRNRRRSAHQQPSLRLRARFYPSGHGLNRQALSDIRGDIATLVRTLGQAAANVGR